MWCLKNPYGYFKILEYIEGLSAPILVQKYWPEVLYNLRNQIHNVRNFHPPVKCFIVMNQLF